jgi:hypothetical protein
MELEEEDSELKLVLKKVLAHYTKFYFDKYIQKNESIQAAATFFDVRTKNVSCFSVKDRK